MKQWSVAAGIAVLATVAGATTYQYVSGPSRSGQDTTRTVAAVERGVAAGKQSAAGSGNTTGATGAMQPATDGRRGTFIVVFRDDALAAHMGTRAGLAAPQRMLDGTGRARLDVKSAQSRSYVGYLQSRQASIRGDIERSLGRPLAVRRSMQHAINGIVTDLSRGEAAVLRANPDVRLVEEYREYALDTDTGPALIGAPPVWSGAAIGAQSGFQGEGMVLGIIDSGINFESPSFAAIDPVDGYIHAKPAGMTDYLGTCAPGGVDFGRCNDKLIGGYDFVCGAPANQCGVANIREEPGFGDTNGHGSHTASTAGGNRRDAMFRGGARRISGVAPRANIIAYDVCYTNTVSGLGSCPNVALVAAVNQVIADGYVDVINYSISGGSQPWGEAVSLAFLNAVEAGVFVASSAGNSGPNPNTLGHLEPWVSATAAAQHGRGDFAFTLQVTGPAPVPAALQPVVLNEGSGGLAHASALPGTTPLRVSPTFAAANDACTAFPAGAFTGAIVVVRRGTCSFTIKSNNVAAAGGIAMIVANNTTGAIIPSVPGTTIRAFGTTQADGIALNDFLATRPSATGGIGFPAIGLPNTPDALGSFSSRGPAGMFDLVKPDVTAPGVSVLAAVSPTASVTGDPLAVALYNGTSMASPHQAGAAVLLRQARPTWSVPEIKSALALTASESVLLEDQVTPANAFAGGSGSIRVNRAINAGLVMNETAANYRAANPAIGGNAAALNQPSMASYRCARSCEFVRTFRNTLPTAQAYSVTLSGLAGRVSPATLKVPAGGSATLRVTIDSSALAANGSYSFGKVTLVPASPRGSTAAVLHLPVAVRVPVPTTTILQLSNLAGATNSDTIYTVNVPAGRPRLIVSTSGGTGDVDLFVSQTQAGAVACASGGSTNYESCSVANPVGGTWYIRLNGYEAYAGVSLRAEVE